MKVRYHLYPLQVYGDVRHDYCGYALADADKLRKENKGDYGFRACKRDASTPKRLQRCKIAMLYFKHAKGTQ